MITAMIICTTKNQRNAGKYAPRVSVVVFAVLPISVVFGLLLFVRYRVQ